MPEKNIPLARKVMEHIRLIADGKQSNEHGPLRWDQETFGQNECGTTACFAGWTCVLADGRESLDWHGDIDNELNIEPYYHIGIRAQKLLGLSPQETEKLFYYLGNDLERYEEIVEEVFGERL